MEENLKFLTFILLLASSLFFLLKLWLPEDWPLRIAFSAAILSVILLFIVLLLRTLAMGHLPFNGIYGFLLCFIWIMLIFYLLLAYYYKIPESGVFVLPIAALLLGVSFFIPSEIKPLMPALRSNWLFLHVFTSILSYGAFALSFGLSLYYITQIPKDTVSESKMELKIKLEKAVYNSIVFGFVFLTSLIITGAVWAEQAWGAWWSWDPKETWSLITWIIYACYFHLRRKPQWRGYRGCYLSIAGFVCVIFTFLGVSYLLPGLHSYM